MRRWGGIRGLLGAQTQKAKEPERTNTKAAWGVRRVEGIRALLEEAGSPAWATTQEKKAILIDRLIKKGNGCPPKKDMPE